MGYIKKIKGIRRADGTISKTHYYYCELVQISDRTHQKIIRPATKDEISTTINNIKNKNEIIYVTCAHPNCDNQQKMTRKQKWKLNVTYPLRYNIFQMVYCSAECQMQHDKILRGGIDDWYESRI